jgi:hypothetical protein
MKRHGHAPTRIHSSSATCSRLGFARNAPGEFYLAFGGGAANVVYQPLAERVISHMWKRHSMPGWSPPTQERSYWERPIERSG